MARIDITGEIIGTMQVMYYVGANERRQSIYHCKCVKCGLEKDMLYGNLTTLRKNGKDGCTHPHIIEVGEKLGSLEVVGQCDDYISPKGEHTKRWLCRCIKCNRNHKITDGSLKRLLDLKTDGCKHSIEINENDVFGSWTIVRKDEKNLHGQDTYLCRCECGRTAFVEKSNLTTGASTRCLKCANKLVGEKSRKDIKDQIFGYLLAMYMVGTYCGQALWHCKCLNCGRETDVFIGALTSGNTRSCGCWHRSQFEDYVEEYLINKGYECGIGYEVQKKFDDLLGTKGGKLSYDFCIYAEETEIAYLIECQGQQHYKVNAAFGGESQFEIQKEHDRRKKEYAEQIGATLITIPYTANSYDKVCKILDQYVL